MLINKYIFFFLLWVFTIKVCNCQNITLNGKKFTGKLNWLIFEGKADNQSSYSANTACYISSGYNGINFVNDSGFLNNLSINLAFDPQKSWVKYDKKTDYLLSHEQGHFNLNMICVFEMKDTLMKTKFTRQNVNINFNKIISEIRNKYALLNIKYDAETNHSINKLEQTKWTNFINAEISKYTLK